MQVGHWISMEKYENLLVFFAPYNILFIFLDIQSQLLIFLLLKSSEVRDTNLQWSWVHAYVVPNKVLVLDPFGYWFW